MTDDPGPGTAPGPAAPPGPAAAPGRTAPPGPAAPAGTGALIRPYLSARVAAEPAPAPAADGAAAGTATVGAPGLRPFLLTSGRTTSVVTIAIETQVISTDDGRDKVDTLTFERRDIVALCEEPLALAEIAAMLGLHLGVVRVLVGDLSTEGLLAVYLPDADVAQDVDTLLRVIRGLRAIS
jgi:Protein of unknown function (DUF742)